MRYQQAPGHSMPYDPPSVASRGPASSNPTATFADAPTAADALDPTSRELPPIAPTPHWMAALRQKPAPPRATTLAEQTFLQLRHGQCD